METGFCSSYPEPVGLVQQFTTWPKCRIPTNTVVVKTSMSMNFHAAPQFPLDRNEKQLYDWVSIICYSNEKDPSVDATTKRLYELKAEIIQAAAHPIRLAVIDFLLDDEKCVCEIVEHVGAQRSNVSRHLAVMLKAGVLKCRKEGLKMMYSLQTPCIAGFLGCVEQTLKKRMTSEAALLKKLG